MKLLIKTAFLLGVMFLTSSTCFAQFTADMLNTENGVTKTSKLSVLDPYYRMDMEENGENIFVIVDQETKVTRVFRPAEKMYMEMGSSGIMSQMNDVFQSINNLKETSEPTLAGTETINGYECEKYNVIRDGKTILTYWQSPSIKFPLKVINQMGDETTMELKNIKEGDVDKSLFQIPDGYQKMQMPGMK
jgi:hypothetical protein